MTNDETNHFIVNDTALKYHSCVVKMCGYSYRLVNNFGGTFRLI